METKNFQLKEQRFDAESRLLSGYASAFGLPADSQGDVIVKGAFAQSILKIKNGGIPLLDSHKQDSEHVLGTVIDAFEDEIGLYITAKLADTPRVEEIRQKLKQGHINKMSIGFFIGKNHYRDHNGEELRFIEEADLIEISVVPIPANDRATILSVKHQEVKEECSCDCHKSQEDGVRAEEATEDASACKPPESVSKSDVQSLNLIADLMQQSLNQTRRKYDGK